MIEIDQGVKPLLNEHLATRLYLEKEFNIQAVKLLPGEYYVTDKDLLLVTVLGSCIAACIRDSQSGIGGMNHFMLPDGGSDSNSPLNASARYGTYAMEILINQLLKLGARRANLEAKVFGGGNVMKELISSNVGQRNADFVLKFLETERIPVIAKDLVDIYPRRVYYFPKQNKVLVKKLKNSSLNNISERERNYSSQLNKARPSGEIELFT